MPPEEENLLLPNGNDRSKRRVAVTGAAGYIGQMLISRLAGQPAIGGITAIDLKPPSVWPTGVEFVKCDIRDRRLASAIQGHETVVHLAFIVADIHNRRLTYEINVHGSRNLLRACEEVKPRKLVVASSVAAYGRQPRDNRRITENTPLVGDNASYYLHTKRLLEEDLDLFERRNPEVIVTRLRPSILLGPLNNNFALELGRFPFMPRVPGGFALPVVHEDDAVRAFILAVEKDAPGPFIISLPEPLTMEDLALAMNKPLLSVSQQNLERMMRVLYTLRLTKLSRDWIISGTGGWRFDLTRSRCVLGWEPRHGLAETLNDMINNIRTRRRKLFRQALPPSPAGGEIFPSCFPSPTAEGIIFPTNGRDSSSPSSQCLFWRPPRREEGG